MTGVLARLVARATGQALPGLRPRLASRFEESPGAGFVEDASEHVASASAPHEAAAAVREIRRELPPAERVGALEAPGPSVEERRKAVFPETKAPTARAPQPAAAPPVAPAEPLRAEARPAPAGPPRQNPPRVEAEPGRVARARHAPPPLLAPAPPLAVRWPQPLPGAPGPAQAARPVASGAAGETTEITIEIGRIELRGDAPKPARVARRPRPAVPSLTDYLRGKGGGG